MSKRIAILADTHVGLSGLHPDGRKYGDVAPLLGRAVEMLGRDDDPLHAAFFVGDIVNRGFEQEYARARRILQPVQRVLEPVVGNHELQRSSVAAFEDTWGVRAIRETLFSDFPAIMLNSGIEGLGDNEWHGTLSQVALQFLDERLTSHRHVPVFVFCHHPVQGTVRGSSERMAFVTNSDEFRRRVERHPRPVVVVSGHTHEQDFQRDGHVTYVGCPPLGFWPHAFLVAEVGESSAEVRTVHVVESAAESPDPQANDADYRDRCAAAETSVTIPLA